jgi:hypothetical protein
MDIRPYQPGDETPQAAIYNAAAAELPAFKAASVEELTRRYRDREGEPRFRFYAVQAGQVVGYVVANSNGRMSYPWCLPEWQSAREPLLTRLVEALRDKGWSEGYVAYRADWVAILDFLKDHGFEHRRDVVNYVAPVERLTTALARQPRLQTNPIEPASVRTLAKTGRGTLGTDDAEALANFYLHNPYIRAEDVFVAQSGAGDELAGFGVAILNEAYADPTQINPYMPCFRLGAFGTERERHKRVQGMVSVLPRNAAAGETILAAAVRRLQSADVRHAAAQASSDQLPLIALYDRYFDRQGAFPVLVRRL